MGELIHHASPISGTSYRTLATSVQALADKAFAVLKKDPLHPSLRFKKVGRYWPARVGLNYRAMSDRAISVETPDGVLWFWIAAT